MMRLPKKNLVKWFSKNYGIGGFENYSQEQVQNVLQALKLILENCGSKELYFLGKFFMKLSESSRLQEDLKDELEDLGF